MNRDRLLHARRVSNVARSGVAISAAVLTLGIAQGLIGAEVTASAAPTAPDGPMTVTNAAGTTSGGTADPFILKTPESGACSGDTASGRYFIASYMVPLSVDPPTLQYGDGVPLPAGVGASFRQPLYLSGSSDPFFSNTGVTTGSVTSQLKPYTLAVFADNGDARTNLPPGDYNVGVACIKGPASASQLDKYWNVVMRLSEDLTDTSGKLRWSVPTVAVPPAAPTGVVVTPGNSQLSIAFAPVTATPGVTSYSARAVPLTGAAISVSGPGSPILIPGLTNGTTYQVTVTATNSNGTSAASSPAVAGTPAAGAVAAQPAVRSLTATPGAAAGVVVLEWDPPSSAGTVPPTSYEVALTPTVAGSPVPVNLGGTTSVELTVSGLTPGTSYTFSVLANYAAPNRGTAASVTATAPGATTTTTTTTTASTATTTASSVAGATVTSPTTPTPASLGSLPRTGPGSTALMIVGAVLLLMFGRMAILAGREIRVLTPGT